MSLWNSKILRKNKYINYQHAYKREYEDGYRHICTIEREQYSIVTGQWIKFYIYMNINI